MTATGVQLSQPVERTPERILNRYRVNRHWRLYEKEWIYRNFPPAGRSWLDFGCGTGEITTQLAMLGASRVFGIDITPGLVQMARRRAELDGVSDRVQLVCGDIRDIAPQPVDVVLSYAVLHHVPDQLPAVITALRKWLKPGGVFICVEPVLYLAAIEWLHQVSGLRQIVLDPGERKLTEADLQVIESAFRVSRRVHFRIFGRFGGAPGIQRSLRRVDALLRALPGTRWLAGTAIVTCDL